MITVKVGECRNKYKAITGEGCLSCGQQKISFSLYRKNERPIIIKGYFLGIAYGFVICRVVKFGKRYTGGIEYRFPKRDVRFIQAPSFCEKGWEKHYKNMFPKRWHPGEVENPCGADGSPQPATIPIENDRVPFGLWR